MKKASLICLISGVLITAIGIIIPLIKIKSYTANNGAVGIIGGADIPTMYFTTTFLLGSSVGWLLYLGLALVLVSIVLFVVKCICNKKQNDNGVKKTENTVLLIGIILQAVFIAWSLFKFIFDIIGYLRLNDENNIKYFLLGNLLPLIIMLIILVFPVIQLIRNVKGKNAKLFSILSIITNSVMSLWLLFSLFTPAIPQYLIYSELGLIDTYFTIFTSFITSGGALLTAASILIIVGSVISLVKNRNERNA